MSGPRLSVALVPGVLALLPEYASEADPVAELRSACVGAVRWLGDGFGVHGTAQGLRVARALAEEAGVEPDLAAEHPEAVLVVANGSACRSEKAPGHVDERAPAFDTALGAALRTGRLSGIDADLARELWADVEALRWLAEHVELDPASTQVDHEDDPYGVQYWVVRWRGQWR